MQNTPQSPPLSPSPSYEPERLEQVFQDAGFDGWRRMGELSWTLASLCGGFWLDNRFAGTARIDRQRRRAAWLKDRFVKLGPTFIKIGQVLSTRPDLVPLPYVEEMASLQDQVPPFDSELAHQIIAQELGRPTTELFALINPFPIAAASIGQVYKAKLHDGRDVVVKVQRPGLIPIMSLDLAVIRKVSRFIDRHPRLSRGMPYTAILDEFGASLFDQADYAKEGGFAERFRDNFAGFPGIGTPRIHWHLTTSRVMTMDFVHGLKVTDLVALEDAGLSFQDIVRLGVRATIKQILEDGFFHADVHPGNLFVEFDGTLVYIDFGMVGEISPFVQEKIVDVFLHSVHRQYDALVRDFIDLEFLSPQVDQQALLPIASHIFQSQYGEKDRRMTVKEVFASVSKVLYDYPFRIPEKIAFILRTIITLEGIIHKLWPDFRFLEVAAPYAAKIMLTDAKANIREKLVNELFVEGEFRLERLGRLFGTATREPTFRFGEVAPSVLRYLTSPEGARVRDGLLSTAGKGAGVTGRGFASYLERAAADPDWTLDDMLGPVFDFLQTEAGTQFLSRAMDLRVLMVTEDGAGPSGSEGWAALGPLFAGRALSADLTNKLFATLSHVVRDPELRLQPLIERAAVFMGAPAGEAWFYAVGEELLARQSNFGGRFVAILDLAVRHPHLDVTPLVRVYFALVMRPQGKAWQDLMVFWFNRGEGGGDGVLRALQPLLADGRLRLSELALPTMGFMFSKEGAPLRDEVITTLRGRLAQVDLGGMAQNLWKAAGHAFQNIRHAAFGDKEGEKMPEGPAEGNLESDREPEQSLLGPAPPESP